VRDLYRSRKPVPSVRFRIVQISPWKLALGATLLFALLLTLFILAAGVFLLVLPVAAVAAVLAYLFGGRTKKKDFPHPDPFDGTIEAEYREVEAKQLERDKK
jgi:hypothetical protein